MDSGMDVKRDTTEGFGIPSDSLLPPPVDLEDMIGAAVDSGEDATILQQMPTSPGGNQILPKLPDLDSGPCYPTAEEISIDLEGDGESERCLEPQDATSLDPEASRNSVEEGAKASAQEEDICGTPNPDQVSEVEGSLKIAVDQGEIPTELEEKDMEEEIPEADQAEFLKLFAQLQSLSPGFYDKFPSCEDDLLAASDSEESHGLGDGDRRPLLEHAEDLQGPPDKCASSLLHVATGQGLRAAAQHLLRSVQGQKSRELLSSEANRENFLSLLHYEGGISMEENDRIALACSDVMMGTGYQKMEVEGRAVTSERAPPEPASDDLKERRRKGPRPSLKLLKEPTDLEAAASSDSNLEAHSWENSPDTRWLPVGEPGLNRTEDSSPTSDPEKKANLSSFPRYKDVPGPCEPEDLLDGVIFGAKYLGSTQLVSEKNPSTRTRMAQAQEAVDRIKAPEGESQPMTEVDLFVSTQRIKVLSADTQVH